MGQNRQFKGNPPLQPLLEMVGLVDAMDIDPAPGPLTIRPAMHPRAGWAEAAAAWEAEGMIDAMDATSFDDEEWAW